MATETVSPAVKAAAFPLTGWAGDVHSLPGVAPAVIVNPDATPAALLGWALGQLSQLNLLLQVIGASADGGIVFPIQDVIGAIRNTTEPVESALTYAMENKRFDGARV
jgi:hypothetical protein